MPLPPLVGDRNGAGRDTAQRSAAIDGAKGQAADHFLPQIDAVGLLHVQFTITSHRSDNIEVISAIGQLAEAPGPVGFNAMP